MTFTEHRDITVCFTGHRPKTFVSNTRYAPEIMLNTVKTLIAMVTADAYSRGARYFISGMAQGVDLWACETLLCMQNFLPDVHIVAVMPYKLHGRSFKDTAAEIFIETGRKADAVIHTSERSDYRQCYYIRNDYMLKHSSAVLGFIRDSKSGTMYTINHAPKFGTERRIVNLTDYKALIPLLERFPEVYRMQTPAQRLEFWQANQRVLYQCGLFSEQ